MMIQFGGPQQILSRPLGAGFVHPLGPAPLGRRTGGIALPSNRGQESERRRRAPQ